MAEGKKPREHISVDRWHAIHTEYIQTNDSIATLSKKHKLPQSTVQNRSIARRWATDRREWQEERLKAAIATQPGIVPPMNPLSLPKIQIPFTQTGELTSDYFLERQKNYFHKNLERITKLEARIDQALSEPFLNIDHIDALHTLGKALDTMAERERIVLGIPLVAPIKRVEKNIKRGGDIVPIDAHETPIQQDPLPPDDSSVDGSAGVEVEEVFPVRKESDEWQ